ncbi:hypothetical protein IL306_003903 [Fusarium sp. DS 682]|nr:hypothetical protein IL306_003903 [Fusarium sp. DS 682]
MEVNMDDETEAAQSVATPRLTQGRRANHPLSAAANENTDTNTIISNPNTGTVVTRIEDILGQIIDALAAGQELSIPFSARRSSRRAADAQPELVRFPGRNQQEAVKFGQNLFEKQGQVDDLVDDIAFTLGISRGDLNIAKGFPDLTTRSFLNFVHTRYPQLPLLGLFDYDPDGVKIFRCYRYGSERLSHEADLGVPALQWLGITSAHLSRDHNGTSSGNFGPPNQLSITSIQCRDPVTYLNGRERATAISTLKKINQYSPHEIEALELRRELQLMTMLGIKAEIEWLDESGNLCSWLDGEIGEALISDAF